MLSFQSGVAAVGTYNPSTQEAEAGSSPVGGQLGLLSETLSLLEIEGGKKGCMHTFIHRGPEQWKGY
jgi:hypothetical protein